MGSTYQSTDISIRFSLEDLLGQDGVDDDLESALTPYQSLKNGGYEYGLVVPFQKLRRGDFQYTFAGGAQTMRDGMEQLMPFGLFQHGRDVGEQSSFALVGQYVRGGGEQNTFFTVAGQFGVDIDSQLSGWATVQCGVKVGQQKGFCLYRYGEDVNQQQWGLLNDGMDVSYQGGLINRRRYEEEEKSWLDWQCGLVNIEVGDVSLMTPWREYFMRNAREAVRRVDEGEGEESWMVPSWIPGYNSVSNLEQRVLRKRKN